MRQTGRTTRMLEEARRLDEEGRAVYVVCANRDQVERLRRRARDMAIPESVKFETDATLSNLDWGRLWLRGAHPNCVVLIDHYAIEERFGPVLEMLHRYDLEAPDGD